MKIAAVTINLIVAVAIVLLNLSVLIVSSSYFQTLLLSIHFQGVAVVTCVGATAGVLSGKLFCDKAFG